MRPTSSQACLQTCGRRWCCTCIRRRLKRCEGVFCICMLPGNRMLHDCIACTVSALHAP